jgi:DNA-binding IclR family transcriptional regulator
MDSRASPEKTARQGAGALDKTFAKGLRLIEYLSTQPTPVGVSEVGRACGFAKTSAHRLLKTLVSEGYVSQGPDNDKYRLNLKLWVLGSHVVARTDVRTVAYPHMLALSEATGETTHLCVLQRDEVIFIETIETNQALRAHTPLGARAPVHCAAHGKAILAFQPDSHLPRIGKTMVRYTGTTVRTLAALRRDLEGIRRQGYAVNRGEWEAKVVGVAAPVRNHVGEVIASIGIAGPLERLNAKVIKQYAKRVVEAARLASLDLGNM